MIYRILADLLVALHGLTILFALCGGLLVLWHRWAAFVHLPFAAWAALVEFNGWICPLTPMENRMRFTAGEAGYEGGFIEHYLLPAIYPSGLTPEIQFWLAIGVIGFNVGIYSFVLIRVWGRSSPEGAR